MQGRGLEETVSEFWLLSRELVGFEKVPWVLEGPFNGPGEPTARGLVADSILPVPSSGGGG